MNASQAARTIVNSLKSAGVDFVATLPDLKIVEVIRAIDGPLFITSCLPYDTGGCEQSGCCTVREPLRQVNDSIRALLDDIKISDMRDSRQRHTAEEPSMQLEELVTLR